MKSPSAASARAANTATVRTVVRVVTVATARRVASARSAASSRVKQRLMPVAMPLRHRPHPRPIRKPKAQNKRPSEKP